MPDPATTAEALAPGRNAEGRFRQADFTRLDGALYAASWFGFLAMVALAALLHPQASGLGTHTQLHLPPCGFYVLFHRPCPSCGMTTAFAWIVRGGFAEAFRVQPAGLAVFLAAAGWWLYLPVGFLKRRPFQHLFEIPAFLATAVSLVAIILGVWGWGLMS